MNKTILTYLQITLKSMLMIVLILVSYQNAFANDNHYLLDTELSGTCYVDAGNDKTICKGESIQICATGADHYEWSNGHTTRCITVSPNSDRNYTVIGTSNNCTDTDHVSIHVNEARWSHVNKGHHAGCGTCDGSIIVDANYSITGEFNVKYTYNGNTVTEGPFTESGDITLGHLCAGTYSDITIIGIHTGCRDVWPDDITIGGGGNIHVNAGDDKTICRGESVQICATGADHYQWSNGHTGSCITVSPNNDKTYTVIGTSNGCTDTDHINIHVDKVKWNHINKVDNAACGSCDGSIDVGYEATGAFKVRYEYNGQTFENGPHDNIEGNVLISSLCAGTYSNITIISVDTGCSDTWPDHIVIGGGENIHVDAGNDKTICQGQSVQICATGADHYQWSDGQTGQCITVSPNNDRTYTVTGTSNGCTDTDHVEVSIGNIHVDAGDDKTICRGESVQICATGADHYEWSNGHTGSCINVSPNNDRTYTVTGTSNGCTDTDHVNVHVNQAKWDNVSKGNDTGCGSTCSGSITIDANNVTGPFEIQYTYNGNTVTEGPFPISGNITFDHLCAGTYSDITIIGINTGCRDVWPHDITIQGGGNIHVDAGDDKAICRGESVQICATGADHYQWSNGHTGQCITVSPNSDRTYTVTGTSNGCTDTDHVSVHVSDCSQNCDNYTLDFERNAIDWANGSVWNNYDIGGNQNIIVDILDYDNIFLDSRENNSGLRVDVAPNNRHDELYIVYTLSQTSSRTVFDITNLDYISGKQQETVFVYGLLNNDNNNLILPTLTPLNHEVNIEHNLATASGQGGMILVEFTECIDKVIVIWGSGDNAPSHPVHSYITVGKNHGFTTEVCQNNCASSHPREDATSVADINIFPNPATTDITLSIETDVTGPADIVIIDELGRVVSQSLIQLVNATNQHQLDVSRLSAGVYFVKVFTKEGQSKAKHLVILDR